MDTSAIKASLETDVTRYIKIIDKLPINALNKTEIVQRYLFSKVKWRFQKYNLTEAWVSENVDSIINKHYKKWLQLSISSNIVHLTVPKTILRLNLRTAKQIYIECKLPTKIILKISSNKEANKLYELTSYKNVREDTIINRSLKKN